MERPDVIPSLKFMLKRQYEDGYDSACDTLEETIVELDRLRKTNEVLRYENIRSRTMFEHAVRKMIAISRFAHPDGFVINGKGYSFHPPDALVREAWEALSKAIREIDTTKLGDPPSEPTGGDGGQNHVPRAEQSEKGGKP